VSGLGLGVGVGVRLGHAFIKRHSGGKIVVQFAIIQELKVHLGLDD